MIRVAVIPIGTVPPEILRDYYSIRSTRSLPLRTSRGRQDRSGSSSCLAELLTVPGRIFSPAARSLLCHCPLSRDLDSVVEQFNSACKGYSSALVDRCFGFFLVTQLINAKKWRLAHAQETIGDYCLLAGLHADENAHYSTSLELARLMGDYFWCARALEGSVCALLVTGQKDSVLGEEVRYCYKCCITESRLSKTLLRGVSNVIMMEFLHSRNLYILSPCIFLTHVSAEELHSNPIHDTYQYRKTTTINPKVVEVQSFVGGLHAMSVV